MRKKIITGLISFFQTYDKEFFQLKTAVCKAPNCSLGKEKLQFGQGEIINQCSVLKKVDRLNLESDIGLHWKSLFLYEFTHCKDNPK